jgi:hypothetical protein
MQITQQKNCLPAQYLVSKDLDPKLPRDTRLFAKESFIITDSTISLQSNSVFDMTYWPILHVHTQHEGAIRLYLHVSTKEKERKKTHKLLDSGSSTSLQCYNIIPCNMEQ